MPERSKPTSRQLEELDRMRRRHPVGVADHQHGRHRQAGISADQS
jgi:hypothetical protein